jgi:Lrp/AsnC family transcriptional regulator, regulator for asnA, asnC and gidA
MESDTGRNKNGKKKDLDKVDFQLIHMLQKDGRLSHIELGKQAGISETTVRYRLKRLIDEEYIQVVAVANPLKLGFDVTGDLFIHAELKTMGYVIDELKKIKELWYIVITTGKANINAEFVVKDFNALHDLIFNRISKIEGVTRVDASVIIKYVKRAYDFGTPSDLFLN